jgi:geranylgeranyl pyrophosphate synthase
VGNAAASEAEVARAVQVLLDSGARQRVEARLAALVDQAQQALQGAPLHAAGIAQLQDLVQLIADRDR